MKKLLSICLVICMALTMVIGMVACKPPQHEHQIKKYWNKDSSGHWKECADPNCKDKFESADHQWNDGEVSIKATPTRIGKTKYTCTICKFEKTEDTEYIPNSVVTAEKWAEAMQLNAACKITLTQTIPGMEEPAIATIKIMDTAIEYDSDATQEVGETNVYVKFEDGNCYNYIHTITPYIANMTMRKTARRGIDESTWENNRNVFAFMVDKFESFTYDQATGTYYAQEIKVDDNTTYTDVRVTFADNYLAKISYKRVVGDQEISMDFDFAYFFYFCSVCYKTYDKIYSIGDSFKCATKETCKKAELITAAQALQIYTPTDPMFFYDLDNPPQQEGGDAENAG